MKFKYLEDLFISEGKADGQVDWCRLISNVNGV